MIKFQEVLDSPDHGRDLALEEVKLWASGFERQIRDSVEYNSPEFLSDIDDLSERVAMHMTGTKRSGKLSHAPDLVSSVMSPQWTVEVKSCLGRLPNVCSNCGETRPVALGFCHHCAHEGRPVVSPSSYQGLVDRGTDDAYIMVRPSFMDSRYEDGGLASMGLRLSFFVLDKDDSYFSKFLKERSSMGFDSLNFWCSGPAKLAEFDVSYSKKSAETYAWTNFYDVLNSTPEPVPVEKLHMPELKSLLSKFDVDKIYKKNKADLVSLLHGFGVHNVSRDESSTCKAAMGSLG